MRLTWTASADAEDGGASTYDTFFPNHETINIVPSDGGTRTDIWLIAVD